MTIADRRSTTADNPDQAWPTSDFAGDAAGAVAFGEAVAPTRQGPRRRHGFAARGSRPDGAVHRLHVARPDDLHVTLNLANLLTQAGSICVLAMGLGFVLLLGDIDLSAGVIGGVWRV